ncbi:MAG TPA: hypothetical protein VE935_20530 [Burkholderiales bacterium]|jgi:hypothetical protein|nr:hypothetical protein [Burkholderiales bacterium]
MAETRLHTLLRDIAAESGVTSAPEMELTLDAVEHAFGRLFLRATGKEKAAALLILRELMPGPVA